MKINKKLIALLLVFTSNLIISADLEDANEDANLEISKNIKVAKIQETQTRLDAQYKELFKTKLAALGKKSIDGDETKTTKVKSFLTDLRQFSEPQKTAFYKYLTNQEFSLPFLEHAFGKEDFDTKVKPQLTDLDEFRRILPINRKAEIETSKSLGNWAKSTTLSSWSSAQEKLIDQEDLHKAATKDFNDFASDSLLPNYERKTLKLLSDIETAVDRAVVEENLKAILKINKEVLEIEKNFFSKFDSKELDATPPLRKGVASKRKGVASNPYSIYSVDEIRYLPQKLRNLLRSLGIRILETVDSANLKLQKFKLVEAEKLKEAEEAKTKLITTNRVKQRQELKELEEAENAKTSANSGAKAKSKAKEDKSVEKRLNAAIVETDQAGLVKSAAGAQTGLAKSQAEQAETAEAGQVKFAERAKELAAKAQAGFKETKAELSAKAQELAAKAQAGFKETKTELSARTAKAQAALKAVFTFKSSTRSNSPQPTRSTSPQPTRSTSPQRGASIVRK